MFVQVGSYFGSVLCPLDVDKDGVTDVLLVGAPMFMSGEKKEMGKVYIFSITNVSHITTNNTNKAKIKTAISQLID